MQIFIISDKNLVITFAYDSLSANLVLRVCKTEESPKIICKDAFY
jgi:hypothetical protein